ncbi:Sodium-coupled neutral amino acid transporter [Perkinsela sp. CCAP 1560/4]|nr:Sodium-coupled neutral amino acid transporter [Perkinsela sp. CCAP 1560/4]|eukprot:KNH09628.1 Sodium-coupled neutral amino acid transporter [Perkinsela sp. CCAP 1560/4]
MQAALDHHLVTSHTGAPDTEPRRAKEKEIVFEAPKYFGSKLNRVEIIKKKEAAVFDDPHVYNPFESKGFASIPRTSANTVLDRLGTDMMPTKRREDSLAEFSPEAGSWSSHAKKVDETISPGNFPDIQTTLEMDPFAKPSLSVPIEKTHVSEAEKGNVESPASDNAETTSSENEVKVIPGNALNRNIILPKNPFATAPGKEVTNPFAPQPDGIGSYNYFAAQLNKKLAIEGMSGSNKGNMASSGAQFTPFHTQGAFPGAMKPIAMQSFVPLAFSPIPSNLQSPSHTMNDSVVSFVQGRNTDNVQSASPFKHGMHTQLEVPKSPYILEIREHATRIIPAEEDNTMRAEKSPVEEDIITFIGEASPRKWTCPRCMKLFHMAEALVKHLLDVHAVTLQVSEADLIQRSPLGWFQTTLDIRQGVRSVGQKSDSSAVVDDMQTEYLRKKFTAALAHKANKSDHSDKESSEDSSISAHLSSVNRIVLTGKAEKVETGSMLGDKYIRFSITIPFDSAPSGENASDTVTVLCDCTPKKDSTSPALPQKEEKKEPTGIHKSMHESKRHIHLQERKAKQVNEMENHILSVVKEGACVCVTGHLRMNPQNTAGGRRFFPIVLVTPSSGFVVQM